MSSEKLYSPLKVGAITAANRIFMAPLTRLRSIEPGDIPTPLMAEYYRQRARRCSRVSCSVCLFMRWSVVDQSV